MSASQDGSYSCSAGHWGRDRRAPTTHTPDVQHYLFSCLSIFLTVEVKHCLVMEQLVKQNSHLNDELRNLWKCGPWLFVVSIGVRHWLKLNISSWKMLWWSWLLLVASNSDHSLQLLSIQTFKHFPRLTHFIHMLYGILACSKCFCHFEPYPLCGIWGSISLYPLYRWPLLVVALCSRICEANCLKCM